MSITAMSTPATSTTMATVLASGGIVDLFVRMVTSLAIVLMIIAVAYAVMRRRAGMSFRPSAATAKRATGQRAGGRRGGLASARGRTSSNLRRPTRRSSRQSVEVLGRVGLTRSSSAVALQFGDRVLLVGACEQSAPTVLAELDAATWELYQADTEWTVPATLPLDDDDDAATAPVGFLDALREATIRRA